MTAGEGGMVISNDDAFERGRVPSTIAAVCRESGFTVTSATDRIIVSANGRA